MPSNENNHTYNLLKMYQNEFKHNSFVAYNAIIRIEDEETKWKLKVKFINLMVIFFSLLTFISTQDILHILNFYQSTAILGFLAFILSIILIVFDKDFDTKLQNDLGDNYWRLYEKTINLECLFLDSKINTDTLSQELDTIFLKHQILVSCSPSHNPLDHKKALQQIENGEYTFYKKSITL